MKTNKTSRLLRRLLGLTLAACFALGGTVTAWADAISTYTVSVSNGQLSILKSGYVTNTFRTAGNNATVTTGTDGNLMVCFYDTNNRYVGVTLGSQQIVNFYGSIGTLRLDSSLDRPVVIGSTATVSKLEVEAPVKVSIWGKVNSGSVDAAATLVAAKGSTVNDVYFNRSSARFYANEGSVIDGTTIRSSEELSSSGSSRPGSSSSSSSSTSTSGTGRYRVTAKSSTIYAIYGETLGDLLDDLEASVEATNRSGRVLDGEVEWVDSDSTRVKETRRYRYRFTPDDSDYDDVTGTVRIVVDDDDEYKEEIYPDDDNDRPITVKYGKRLSSYLSKLKDRLTFYNEDDKIVRGKVKWTNGDKKITQDGTYKYVFTPNNSKYRTYKGEIEIIVED